MGNDARIQQMLKPSKRFYPFTRDDSQHMVYGPATSEAVDSYNTVFTLDATREALADYEKWRTLRAMHDPIAAGTVPVLELESASLQGCVLQIGARVVDEAEWIKVRTDTYKGFSIGFDPLDGHYEMRDGRDVFVFTAYRLIEISLVDRPANPDCSFTLYRSASPYTLTVKDAPWTFEWQRDFEAIRAKGGAAMLKDAMAWCAPDAEEDPKSYALPVARLEEGGEQLTLNLYALCAAAAGLNGARAHLAIPDGDRAAVQSRLSALFALYDETPPEFNRRAQEDTMDEKELSAAVEKGVVAFFKRLMGVGKEAPAPKPEDQPAPKIRMAKADHERMTAANEALKAGITAESPATVRAAADAMDALLAAAEVKAPPPPETPPADEALTARVVALEAANTALKAGLDKALASRQSQDTVMGDTPFKSRYGGAFIR